MYKRGDRAKTVIKNMQKCLCMQREKSGLTFEQIEQATGIDKRLLGAVEGRVQLVGLDGYPLPDVPMLCALADAYGVSLDEFVGRA
nr:MAG TPA: Helix-turn-helix XRE-family like protein [Caudoviricetes sp.]